MQHPAPGGKSHRRPQLDDEQLLLRERPREFLAPALQVAAAARTHEDLPRLLLDEAATPGIEPAAIGVEDGEAVREIPKGDFADAGVVAPRETFPRGRQMARAEEQGVASEVHAFIDRHGTNPLARTPRPSSGFAPPAGDLRLARRISEASIRCFTKG